MAKSASKQIEELFSQVDSQSLSAGTVKSKLMIILQAVTALEGGSSNPDLEQENEALKTELEAAKTDLETCKTNSASQINILCTELDALRTEQAKREEQEKINLPSEQIEVLRALQPPEVEKRTVSNTQYTIGMLRVCEVPYHTMQDILDAIPHADEIVLHLQNLERLKLVERGINSIGETAWFRTIAGNKRVIAERLATE